MKVIGITGGVGAGKTQVLEYLHDKYGATICQADMVAKKLQRKGSLCFEAIVSHFGVGILDEQGELDREQLARIVFADQKALETLNNIMHPVVKTTIQKHIKNEQRKNTSLFLLEAALLIEGNYSGDCDELWYIYVEDEVRKKRLVYTRGYDAAKVERIIAAQMPKAIFVEHCDRIIDNNGHFEETKEQLDEAIANIRG